MKRTKRLFAVMISVLLLMSSAACGNGGDSAGEAPENSGDGAGTSAGTERKTATPETDSTGGEKIKIAVMNQSWNDTALMTKDYYDNYIAPNFNVEFLYSEECADTDSMITFAETAANSGASGMLFYGTTAEDVLYTAARCDELGMYFIANSTYEQPESISDNRHFAGLIGSSAETVADQFREITNTVTGGEPCNVVIASVNASIGLEQHVLSTEAILNVLKENYGLTYSEDVSSLATVTSITNINTGTDMKICIVPGAKTITDDMYSVLKGGEYNIVISVAPMYTLFENIVSDVEKEHDVDIRIASIAAMTDTTYTSFHTEDIFGNASLNIALIKNNTIAGSMFAGLYNVILEDDVSSLRDADGTYIVYDNLMWICSSPEEYDLINKLDKDEATYSYTVEDLKQMIRSYNPELDSTVFAEWCNASDFDAVAERRGLK